MAASSESRRGSSAAPSAGSSGGASGANAVSSAAAAAAAAAVSARKENKDSDKDVSLLVGKAQALKKSVEGAINESEKIRKQRWEEETGAKEEEEALRKKIETMNKEVRLKNKQVKVLIDEFRELYRDLVLLVASRKAAMPSLNEG